MDWLVTSMRERPQRVHDADPDDPATRPMMVMVTISSSNVNPRLCDRFRLW
jgi:hypothetical protein